MTSENYKYTAACENCNDFSWIVSVIAIAFVQLLFIAYVPQKIMEETTEMKKGFFKQQRSVLKVSKVGFCTKTSYKIIFLENRRNICASNDTPVPEVIHFGTV